jgi:hypothetical protein
MYVILETKGALMRQCYMTMHDDAHDQVLVAFNIWDVTITPIKEISSRDYEVT